MPKMEKGISLHETRKCRTYQRTIKNHLGPEVSHIIEEYPPEKSLLKKCSLPLKISPVNVTKSAGKFGFGYIYYRNS